jgi:anti-sigma factor RsiW
MTCEEFERLLLDSSSSATTGCWMLPASRGALVRAHVENCPACATKMTEATQLEDALDELRLSTRHMQAPPAVEKTLLGRFHREAARPRSSVRAALPWRRVWLSAVAVMLVTAGLLFFSRLRPSSPVTPGKHETEAESRTPYSPADSGVLERAPNEHGGFAT